MSAREYDAVVIGGGMSGITASLTLVSRGLTVALISRGDPVCCLSTGCIDVLGVNGPPLEALSDLPDDHPYRLVGKKAVKEALASFLSVMDEAGLPYAGAPGRNRKILTPIGSMKTTCLVPHTMVHADVPAEEHLRVISFAGLKDFFPGYITSRFRNSECSVFDAGVSTTMGIAELFDEEPFVETFISWLKKLELHHDRLAIPAVLGMNDPGSVIERISQATGRKVFEIPTLPPSVPGLRLFRAMKRVMRNRGVHLYWGKEVASVECLGSRVEAVTLETPGRASRVQGRAFILATGSFVSGGLFAGRTSVRETVFGLPMAVPAERRDWFDTDFFSGCHALERSGIRVDAEFRPEGTRLENLFACGSILAGCEIMRRRCGHGLAIATGAAAAESCARELT
ncbi:MAG: anaerobic glycerol-3-phosphate dehydrogenase subunit GlpB [Desulfomonilia bacterium]|jgi:glycerol-3-phosphate dehydrogenase subunit B